MADSLQDGPSTAPLVFAPGRNPLPHGTGVGLCDQGRSDTMSLPRLGHKRHGGFHHSHIHSLLLGPSFGGNHLSCPEQPCGEVHVGTI